MPRKWSKPFDEKYPRMDTVGPKAKVLQEARARDGAEGRGQDGRGARRLLNDVRYFELYGFA